MATDPLYEGQILPRLCPFDLAEDRQDTLYDPRVKWWVALRSTHPTLPLLFGTPEPPLSKEPGETATSPLPEIGSSCGNVLLFIIRGWRSLVCPRNPLHGGQRYKNAKPCPRCFVSGMLVETNEFYRLLSMTPPTQRPLFGEPDVHVVVADVRHLVVTLDPGLH